MNINAVVDVTCNSHCDGGEKWRCSTYFYGGTNRLLVTEKHKYTNHNKLKSAMFISLVALVLLSICSSFTSAQDILTQLTAETDQNVPFITVNTSVFKVVSDVTNGNNFFVAARNFIFTLNSSLAITHSLKNGPLRESSNCLGPNCPDAVFKDQDNHILLMLLIPPRPKLLTCGTSHNGQCAIVDFSRDFTGFIGRPDDASNFISSRKNTLAFQIPGPNNQTAFMFAHEYDHRPLQWSPPALAARQVDYERLALRFVYSGRQNSSLDVNSFLKKSYPINFIYGFYERNFTYIISNQKVIDSSNSPKDQFTARIGRICANDYTFNSYTELSLVCHGNDRASDGPFDIATAAHFGSLGSETANLMRVKKDRFLFIAFAKSKPGEKPKRDAKSGSVICGVPIDQLNSKFNDVTEKCFEGDTREAQLHAAFNTVVGGDNSCEKHRFEKEYCGQSSYNHYILARRPVELDNVLLTLKEDHTVTSLVTYVSRKSTLALIGSDQGEVMKAVLLPKDAPLPTLPQLDKGVLFYRKFAPQETDPRSSKVRPEPAMSRDGSFALFSLANRIVKFPTSSCSIYPRCSQCVQTPDPLGCGWCGDKCASSAECSSPNKLSDICPPIIHSVEPSSVPFEGGTRITIRGDNFGTSQSLRNSPPSPMVTIFVGRIAIDCTVDQVTNEEIICYTKSFDSYSGKSAAGQLDVAVDESAKSLGNYSIKGRATSTHPIVFFRTKVTYIQPRSGPISGGTKIKIEGKNLDIGYKRRAYFVELINGSPRLVSECEIINIQSDRLECKTSPYSGTNNTAQLFVQVDALEVATGLAFTFKSDPQIKDIFPKAAPISSKMKIKVSGDNLNLLARPYLRIANATKASCNVKNNQTIICSLPKVNDTLIGKRYPMVMTDEETPVATQGENEFIFHPDPDFYQLSKADHVYLDDKILQLRGNNLSTEYPLDITVGSEKAPCIPISGDKFAIHCAIKFEKKGPKAGEDLEVKYSVGSLGGTLGKVVFLERAPHSINPYFIVGITVVSMAVIILAFFLCLKFRGDKDASEVKFVSEKSPHNSYSLDRLDETDGEARPLMNQRFDEEKIAQFASSKKLIAHEYLKRGELIGKGHFGRVFKGNLELPGENSVVEVAIKTLQYVNSPDELDSFLKEASVMKDFDHPNIMSLVGLVFPKDEDAPLLVLPYMCNGDLLAFVRDESRMPRARDLMNFSLDIARGMEYLASQKFVHRDLAARNCMLDENLNVYVADFGLSKDVYEKGYYRPQERGPLPWKWMAPESIKMSTFTSKSDVWSYAITCWEIFTRGAVPYSTVDNCQLEEYLDKGYRLRKPVYCAERIYDLWLTCWSYDPKERPSFEEIIEEIQNFMIAAETTLHTEIPSNSTYSNVARGRYYNETDDPSSDDEPPTERPRPQPINKPRIEYCPTTSL